MISKQIYRCVFTMDIANNDNTDTESKNVCIMHGCVIKCNFSMNFDANCSFKGFKKIIIIINTGKKNTYITQ